LHTGFAKDWALRDPAGSEHRFRDLFRFIRDHPELFGHSETEQRRYQEGLRKLRPTNSRPHLSYRGWTLADQENKKRN
jgi:hypothetical protein